MIWWSLWRNTLHDEQHRDKVPKPEGMIENIIKFNKTDNVHTTLTFTRVRATIFAVEKQYLLHIPSVCVYSLKHPAWNAHVPHRHEDSPAILHLPTLSHKERIFFKCLLWFSLQLLSETLLILRRTERDMMKNIHWYLCKLPVILVRFWWNLNFLSTFKKKNSNIKFHEDIYFRSRTVPRGDGQTCQSQWPLSTILRIQLRTCTNNTYTIQQWSANTF
jgi:hypothetical protein